MAADIAINTLTRILNISKGGHPQLSTSLGGAQRNVGDRPREWELIPNAPSTLLPELKSMYWAGVRRELVQIIRTLKAWREIEADEGGGELEEEGGDKICGFDTFLDSVSESSREFAVRYGELPPLTSGPFYMKPH